MRTFYSLKTLYVLIILIFFAFSWKSFQSHIFNIHFVDEDENIVAGYYMARGEKLYSDIFSHKQPLPAITSMALQKTVDPPNLFMLMKRHREIVFFYSIIWSLIFIWVFGIPGFIYSISIEIIKPFLLGNLFLGESLAIFPAVYIMGFFWKLLRREKYIHRLEKTIFIASLGLLLFLLFTLIPYLILSTIVILIFSKSRRKYILSIISFILLLFICTIPFVNYLKYFANTVLALQTLYLKDTAGAGLWTIITNSFFRPIIALTSVDNSDFARLIKIISATYIISFIYLFLVKKQVRKFLIISLILLGISSTRLIVPTTALYDGFHGLPWLALILFLSILYLWEIWQTKLIMKFLVIILMGYIGLSGRFMVTDYYQKVDRERDFYINFSPYRDFGEIIKQRAKPTDTLIVLPINQLIYWQSGLRHATRFLYGYEWLFVNPSIRQEIKNSINKESPVFIYYDRAIMGKDAWSIFDKYVDSYTRYKQGDTQTPLFIRKDRFNNIISDTKNE
ncbi:MAG: hypothetical protein V1858_03945 [Candidatus Gottesmanbacteria bacterium]